MPLLESPDTALVTGASSGVGATYAYRLAQRGHPLVLVARRADRLQALAERIERKYGVAAEVLAADLTSPPERNAVEQRLREDERIGLLVNNAGMVAGGSLAEASPDEVEAMIQLNVTAPTRLAGAMLPRLLARGRGGIINIASVLALLPELSRGAYPATSGYLLAYTRTLHEEVAGRGVRAQAVLPGITRSATWERASGDFDELPPSLVMEVAELVDAALAGYDQGELVTVPALPDPAQWERYEAARLALAPDLSRDHAADRYKSDILEDA